MPNKLEKSKLVDSIISNSGLYLPREISFQQLLRSLLALKIAQVFLSQVELQAHQKELSSLTETSWAASQASITMLISDSVQLILIFPIFHYLIWWNEL